MQINGDSCSVSGMSLCVLSGGWGGVRCFRVVACGVVRLKYR